LQTPPHGLDPATIRGLTQRRLSRRGFLRAAAIGAGAAALPSLLGGCGSPSSAATPGATPSDWQQWWPQQHMTGQLNFANWPYYIDRRKGNAHPSLDLFTSETGTVVNYSRPVRGNATFLDKIQPALAAGRPTGYDLIVMTNGPAVSALIDSEWLTPLDHGSLTNFDANASDLVRDPPWDPGNRFTIAWQSGLTGIAYRPEAVEALGRAPTSVNDLWDPALAGRVGMFRDEMDLGSFGLMHIGVDPQSSSVYDWSGAADALRDQRDSGVVAGYYDQEYLQALQRGDIWITQAWSGDIFQANQLGHPELEFVIPDEGAMLWTDNMMIPIGAEHPRDAMTYIDFVYRPEVAAMIADWVWYITPVPAAKPIIRDRYGDAVIANSPLVFPKTTALAGGASPSPTVNADGSGSIAATNGGAPLLRRYYVFKGSDELAIWRRFFDPIAAGTGPTAAATPEG
jgi:spermidine/putrescine transport system substrate-binding protein